VDGRALLLQDLLHSVIGMGAVLESWLGRGGVMKVGTNRESFLDETQQEPAEFCPSSSFEAWNLARGRF